MTDKHFGDLSRREREIMEIVYRLGEAGANEVASRMRDDPGYDSVRVTIGILEKKGYLKHRQDGRRYLYAPTVPHNKATQNAMHNLLQIFFRGSPSKAVLSLLDMSSTRLSPEELDEIAEWIEKERKAHENAAD